MAQGMMNPVRAAELVAARILAAVETESSQAAAPVINHGETTNHSAHDTLSALETSYRAGATLRATNQRLVKGLLATRHPGQG